MRKESIERHAVHNTYETKKTTPFELHPVQKPRTESPNIIKDGKSFLYKWSELPVLANNRPKIPIYVTRIGEGELSNQIIMARTKTV